MYTLDFITDLYKKYYEPLKAVKAYQEGLYSRVGCGSDDIECEITYLLIRHFKPQTVVEISPNQGWSTSWLLQGLRDNNSGNLFSYDMIDDSYRLLPAELTQGRWKFILGDAMKSLDKIPKNIDYLYIDSDHYCEFTNWYIDNIFPLLRTGTPVSIHDIYHDTHPETYMEDERGLVMKWLFDNNIPFFSPSKFKNEEVYRSLEDFRNKIGLTTRHNSIVNPMIYFLSK